MATFFGYRSLDILWAISVSKFSFNQVSHWAELVLTEASLGTEGEIDVLIAGLGTGGTICGAGKYLKEQNPDVRLVAIELESSPFISQGIFNPHRMMGTDPGFVPETFDRGVIDEIALVKEEDAFAMCRQLASDNGILVGITSGAVACVLKRMGELPEYKGKTLVGIFADSGERYLSVEGLFNS